MSPNTATALKESKRNQIKIIFTIRADDHERCLVTTLRRANRRRTSCNWYTNKGQSHQRGAKGGHRMQLLQLLRKRPATCASQSAQAQPLPPPLLLGPGWQTNSRHCLCML